MFSISVKPFFMSAKSNDAPAIVATLVIEIDDLGVKESKSIVIPMHLDESQLDVMMNTAVEHFKSYVKQRYRVAYEQFHKQKETNDGAH